MYPLPTLCGLHIMHISPFIQIPVDCSPCLPNAKMEKKNYAIFDRGPFSFAVLRPDLPKGFIPLTPFFRLGQHSALFLDFYAISNVAGPLPWSPIFGRVVWPVLHCVTIKIYIYCNDNNIKSAAATGHNSRARARARLGCAFHSKVQPFIVLCIL